MSPWPFVVASYAVTLGGGAALALFSYLAMTRAERSDGRGDRR